MKSRNHPRPLFRRNPFEIRTLKRKFITRFIYFFVLQSLSPATTKCCVEANHQTVARKSLFGSEQRTKKNTPRENKLQLKMYHLKSACVSGCGLSLYFVSVIIFVTTGNALVNFKQLFIFVEINMLLTSISGIVVNEQTIAIFFFKL